MQSDWALTELYYTCTSLDTVDHYTFVLKRHQVNVENVKCIMVQCTEAMDSSLTWTAQFKMSDSERNLSSVKPLQLLSFSLLGHRLLLLPPLPLCTQLGQRGAKNSLDIVHTCKYSRCNTSLHCAAFQWVEMVYTNLLIGCQVFMFVVTRRQLFQILLTGG